MKKAFVVLMGVLYLSVAGLAMADGTAPAATPGVKAAGKAKVKGMKKAKVKKAAAVKASGQKASNGMEGGEMQGGEKKN